MQLAVAIEEDNGRRHHADLVRVVGDMDDFLHIQGHAVVIVHRLHFFSFLAG
ncbi:hypothetical protein D3C86_1814150 [compost metagenome]